MSSALDTNVLSALFDRYDPNHEAASRILQRQISVEKLVVSGAVFAELTASPRRDPKQIEGFLDIAGIAIDWQITESMWRVAASAYRGYSVRRKRNGSGEARRILPDFLIGAHALENKMRLITLDTRVYRASFPKLDIFVVKGEST
jgi:predicted nucleic acid-binding protein